MIRRFARPYARAIIDVAGSPQKANNIRVELARFEQIRRANAELQELYANPGIELETKFKVTQTIASRLSLSEMTGKVLDILIRNHRVNDLEAIVDALAEYVNNALGIAVAEVRSASRLSEQDVAELRKALEKKVGRRVEIRITTDESLLGGFVAKVGSEVYDASVVGKIHKFRSQLSLP